MSEDPCNIGIMHPAFQVPKTHLLKWINEFFELSYTKVEQCASGAVHCQILDCLFPGKVPMSKVNWDAKSDYEFTNNFKIVQGCFTKMHISKPIYIEKLVKAKYQDNLEFLQWMKHFFDCKYSGQTYNAAERRAKGKGGSKIKSAGLKSSSKTEKSEEKTAPKKVTTKTTTARSATNKKPATKTASASNAELESLKEQMATLQATCEGLEKERNFYFGKLREIEILCQQEDEEAGPTPKEVKAAVLEILYATDEGDEAEAEAEAEAGAEDEEETF
mmetsp:Transcript_8345/g.12522  ORF Transcript_8345/g.12522 Transcript_8345/m.12522 type:complete len:275 (+) Transcript_8345:52-876(+)|eukprot:CAMPEP_0175088512 /NCGR_PEP_ID=MMETSP0086_2-20121207/288_1 /TAXON_ID=136419 /ORGANISM="Unknown Unknown, Strain D1" /LENGTH=274 /DNA_ID=CAMNT_0016360951 /DNA_START=48 /DNA_END=872 /DNA_ORIENTATION=+